MRLHPPHLPTFRLADHVRACRVEDQVILLDLRRNKYLGIADSDRYALGERVRGWPPGPVIPAAPHDASRTARWIAPLVRQGMLDSSPGTVAPPPELDEPRQTLSPEEAFGAAPFVWRDLFSMWTSAAVAAHWLRHRTLADIVKLVAGAKRRAAPGKPPTDAELRPALAAYLRARPFALTAHDRCLHDSLTLTRFLAARGLFPQWVIGVRTAPFGAHSWVQSGHTVLNDVHENVRRYRPILVV